MDDQYADELRNGRADDTGPSPWEWPWSWAAATVVVVLVAGLLGWQGGRSRRDDSAVARRTGLPVATATATQTTTPTPTPRPTGFAGEAIESVAGVDLVLGGGRPSVVSLSNGGATELTGLPPDALVAQLLRVHERTLVLAGRDAPRPPAWAVYAIADGACGRSRPPHRLSLQRRPIWRGGRTTAASARAAAAGSTSPTSETRRTS